MPVPPNFRDCGSERIECKRWTEQLYHKRNNRQIDMTEEQAPDKANVDVQDSSSTDDIVRILCQFKDEDGKEAGSPLDLPITISKTQLGQLCNALLDKVSSLNILSIRSDMFCIQLIICSRFTCLTSGDFPGLL